MLKRFDANKLFRTQIVFYFFLSPCCYSLSIFIGFISLVLVPFASLHAYSAKDALYRAQSAHAYCYSISKAIMKGMACNTQIHTNELDSNRRWLAVCALVWWWCRISYTSASDVSEPKMHEHERIGLRFVLFRLCFALPCCTLTVCICVIFVHTPFV